MKFENKYFRDFRFSREQIEQNFQNALKDMRIVKEVKIREVKFAYSYSALIKAGITLLSFYNKKVRSVPGHHIKILEMTAKALADDSINDMGNAMRSKRNLDFYAGGVEVTEKELVDYIAFVEDVPARIKKIIK